MQDLLAARRNRQPHLTAIFGYAGAPDQAPLLKAVDKADDRVVAQQQTSGNRADGRRSIVTRYVLRELMR